MDSVAQEHNAALTAAANILRSEYNNNPFYRDAVVASVKSAMRETTIVWEEWEYDEAAKKIADRVMG